METTKKEDHGREQAQAQLESIIEMVAALECDYDRLEELRNERTGLLEQTIEHGDLPEVHTDLAEWDKDNGEELRELEEAAGDCESREDAEQRIQEDPLDVQVRENWHSPGESGEVGEFTILLCTGGPAVRIVGELNQYKEPCRAWLEYQDWFTPWQEYIQPGTQDALLTYCRRFYFGE